MSDEMKQTTMDDVMRWKVANAVAQYGLSGTGFDKTIDAILALITAELERVERERDEAREEALRKAATE